MTSIWMILHCNWPSHRVSLAEIPPSIAAPSEIHLPPLLSHWRKTTLESLPVIMTRFSLKVTFPFCSQYPGRHQSTRENCWVSGARWFRFHVGIFLRIPTHVYLMKCHKGLFYFPEMATFLQACFCLCCCLLHSAPCPSSPPPRALGQGQLCSAS